MECAHILGTRLWREGESAGVLTSERGVEKGVLWAHSRCRYLSTPARFRCLLHSANVILHCCICTYVNTYTYTRTYTRTHTRHTHITTRTRREADDTPRPHLPYLCFMLLQYVQVCCGVLQCVAVRCSVLQCVAVCCGVLQCTAVCCLVLQRVAACCSV